MKEIWHNKRLYVLKYNYICQLFLLVLIHGPLCLAPFGLNPSGAKHFPKIMNKFSNKRKKSSMNIEVDGYVITYCK